MNATTANTRSFPADMQHGLPQIVRDALVQFRAALAVRRERARIYQELARSSDHELPDMRISRSDIAQIAANWQPN